MRLYLTQGYTEKDRGDASCWVKQWHGTQLDARIARNTMKADGLTKIETKEVNVPTDKEGLLAWLNVHAVGE